MEPAETPLRKLKINYAVYARCVRLEEKFVKAYVDGVGEEARFIDQSCGWFASFEGSYEALHFGDTKPTFDVGNLVKITFEKIDG